MLLKSKNGNVECISKFFNNCNRDKIKLFLNFESIDNFSCYIKLYALDNNIAHSILESNSFCISFEIEYESVAGIAIKLFHQLWVERNDAQYIVTSSRTTNLVKKEISAVRTDVDKLKNKMVYAWVDDNMPDRAKPTVTKLMRKGYLKADAEGKLNLDDNMLRILVINDRAGIYGE